ncbi:benzoate-CoA ligase family protein [Chamaesiphon minutus]|uniref:Benzoate-CoA ligase family n=1 Tax=Chamaesiphon minutus (strain ATCC 27169 / PCC 6605) TaxID=1173020 RepID=K9UFS8_CHAP6|nr:benzoate-CoA ligase family protein [Chamaesiphon minutus]AFY93675.1 benzoate-CoA ligase family [Chamaesiphon minutus PCC 6605]
MKTISTSLPDIFNVAAYFLEANLAPDRRDRVAIYYRDDTYTYAQVHSWVRRMAKFLAELGVDRERRIAILLPDTPEFVFAFWGAIWLGVVPVPINTACTLEDVRYILQDCRAQVLVTDRSWLERLGAVESPFLQHVVQTDGDRSLISLLKQQDESVDWVQTDREEPAFWLYTSGSTGRPKGVIHLHQSMVVCAENYGKELVGLQADDIIYSVAKIPFAYGLGNTLYMPMSVGAAAILSDAANAFDIIADIQTYQPTVLFGIPGIYAGILSLAEIAPLDTSSLRLCLSAAEQLPTTIWLKWREMYGLEICEGIGTTELLHIFLSNQPGACRPGTSGLPVPGYDVRVVDDRGVTAPDGEIGALEVSGESLMLGYWNRLSATRSALYGTTMRTGDKYVRDADGYFRFMGRNDDFFKVNGMWVSPFEVEDVLLQHQSILDAAVVPSAELDGDLTQVIAYVSLKSEFAPSIELERSIRQAVKAQLSPFKVPKSIQFLDALPRTPTGKVHRQALLKI